MNADVIAIFLVSFVFAAVASAIAVVLVLRRYKNKLQSPTYPVEKYTSLNLSHVSDNFHGRTVTRIKVSSSNNRRK